VINKYFKFALYLKTQTMKNETINKLKSAYEIWNKMLPMERYEKVIKFIPAEKLKGVRGLRHCANYILDNNIN
jgi:hypothetical protein